MIKKIRINNRLEAAEYIADKPAEGKPTVILSHGFLVNYDYMISYAEKLMDKGISSVLFDYAGGSLTSRSTGSIKDMSVLTEKEDLKEVLEYTLKQDYVNPERVYLLGHSQGGFESALLANDMPDSIKALYLVSPGFNILGRVNAVDLSDPEIYKTTKFGGITEKYVLDARTVKLYDSFTNFKKEVLIFHGTDDRQVNIKYSEGAVDAYENAVLYKLENEQHNLSDAGIEIVCDIIEENIIVI